MKNYRISLYCHFNKIMKVPGPTFQSPLLSLKHVINIFHTAHWYLAKFHYNFHYVAMPMVTLQMTVKTVDFTKTQKSRYLQNKTLPFLKKCINYTSRGTLWQKIVL